ncbi:MAG: hypothetical protein KUG81_06370 [Gammaproteobacteria bacterium]|nr:hypothetical protein [Gammaproteobacteria bacterium]
MSIEDLPKRLQPKTPGGLLKRSYIRRMTSDIFNEINDHNPDIATACPECKERGFIRTLSKGDSGCKNCDAVGYLEQSIKLFDVSFFDPRQRKKKVEPNQNGSVKCPCCHKTFKVSSNQHWSGLRHTCGQKLVLKGEYASLCHTKNS